MCILTDKRSDVIGRDMYRNCKVDEVSGSCACCDVWVDEEEDKHCLFGLIRLSDIAPV